MAETFHFLQPLWLLAMLPLMLLLWLLHRCMGEENPWRKVVDAALLPLLLTEGRGSAGRLSWWLLAIGWLVTVLALANPSWDKRPQPLFQSGHARVIVLDLSSSMKAADLKPSRLVRARFKVADILARHKQGLTEGRNALVVFAGDAFAVAPLTRDAETVNALLKSLDPGIMPVQGSRVDLGLIKAGELLRQAGAAHGKVLLLTDGFVGKDALEVARDLRRRGHSVSVLGIGTVEGAPVSLGGGGFLRDAEGNVVIPKLDPDALQALASAGGGVYATLREDDSDLNDLLQSGARKQSAGTEAAGMETETWIERGPWLSILLLPLAALAFRRGWLLAVLLLAGGVLPTQNAMAFTWQDLWQRHDQQAADALEAGEPARAAELADDPLRRGAARYRGGDYQGSLEDFSQADGAHAAYNRGNALARLGEYPKAIDAYDQALELAPDMEDARVNKAAVEKLLPQQKQQQESSSQGHEPDQGQQAENQSGEGKKQEEGGEQESGQQQGEEPSGGQDAQSADPSPTQSGTTQSGTTESGNGEQSQEQQPDAGEAPEQGGDNQFAEAAEAAGQETEAAKQASRAESEPETGAGENDTDKRDNGEHPLEARSEEGGDPSDGPANNGIATAGELTSEEQMAAEQWLRRIPDDPGGLLRRKFLYQYRQRPTPPGAGSEQPW